MKKAVNILSIINLVIGLIGIIPYIYFAVSFMLNPDIMNPLYGVLFIVLSVFVVPAIIVSIYTIKKLKVAKSMNDLILASILNFLFTNFIIGILILFIKEEDLQNHEMLNKNN